MLRKSLLVFLLLINASIALNAKNGPFDIKKRSFYSCTLTQDNFNPASGYVVIKWVSGPPMPTSSAPYYAVDMSNVSISSTGG